MKNILLLFTSSLFIPVLSFALPMWQEDQCELTSPVRFEDGSSIYTVKKARKYTTPLSIIALKDSIGSNYGCMSDTRYCRIGDDLIQSPLSYPGRHIFGRIPWDFRLKGLNTTSLDGKVALNMKVLSKLSSNKKYICRKGDDAIDMGHDEYEYGLFSVEFKRTYQGRTQKAKGQLKCISLYTSANLAACYKNQ